MKRLMSAAIAALVVAASLATLRAQDLGALAPANLNKPRPAAPFDVTGT